MALTIVVPVRGRWWVVNKILNPSEVVITSMVAKQSKIHDWKRSGVSESYYSKTSNRVCRSRRRYYHQAGKSRGSRDFLFPSSWKSTDVLDAVDITSHDEKEEK
jgi:hypothetical protein